MNLSIAQSYLLCVIKNDGTIPKLSFDDNWLIAAGMLDLILDGIIENYNDKIVVRKDLPENLSYLGLLYNFFTSSDKNTKLSLMEFSIKDFGKSKNELFKNIAHSLEKAGAVHSVTKSNIFGESKSFIPNKKDRNSIIEQIRAEILEDGAISDDTVALSMLLEKTSHLNDYFSKHERKRLKEKIEKIRNSAICSPVKDAIDSTIGILSIFTIILGAI